MDITLAERYLHGLSHDVVVVPAFGIDPVALADPSGTHDIDLQSEATLPTIVLQKSPSHSQTLPKSNQACWATPSIPNHAQIPDFAQHFFRSSTANG